MAMLGDIWNGIRNMAPEQKQHIRDLAQAGLVAQYGGNYGNALDQIRQQKHMSSVRQVQARQAQQRINDQAKRDLRTDEYRTSQLGQTGRYYDYLEGIQGKKADDEKKRAEAMAKIAAAKTPGEAYQAAISSGVPDMVAWGTKGKWETAKPKDTEWVGDNIVIDGQHTRVVRPKKGDNPTAYKVLGPLAGDKDKAVNPQLPTAPLVEVAQDMLSDSDLSLSGGESAAAYDLARLYLKYQREGLSPKDAWKRGLNDIRSGVTKSRGLLYGANDSYTPGQLNINDYQER